MSEPVIASVDKDLNGAKSSLTRRFFMILLFVLSSMLLSLWVLPSAMEYAAVSWLQKHGVKDATIENIDLNLFRGTFSIEGLKAGEGLKAEHLSLQVDWSALLNHVVHIRSLQLNKAAIDLTQNSETWQLADIQMPSTDLETDQVPAEEQGDSPWIIVVDDMVLSAVALRVTANGFALELPVKSLQFSLSDLHKQKQNIVHNIELGPTTFSGFTYKVNYQHLESSGESSLSLFSSDLLQSMQSRKLALKLGELKVANDADRALLSLLSLQFDDLEMRGGEEFVVESIDMHKMHIEKELTGTGSLALDRLHAGRIDVDLAGDINLSTLRLDALTADGFAGNDDHLRVKQILLSALTRTANETLSLASLKLQNVELKQGEQFVGAVANTTLEDFSMRGVDKGAFKLLKLDAVQLPSNAQGALGTIGSIQADRVMLDSGGLYRAKQLRFEDVNSTIIIQKDGTLAVLDAISKSLPASSAKPGPTKETAKPTASSVSKTEKEPDSAVVKEAVKEPVVIIDAFIVSEGSHITLQDLSVVPALNTEMSVQHFRFAPLDSSGKQAGQLDMQVQMGKSGTLIVKGELLPAAGDALRTDLIVKLKNYDLARLSGYIETDFGKSIKTGQFNLDSSMKIAKGSLDTKNRVLIRQLELGDSKQPGKAALKLGMPVGAALNMLRDSRGDIDLDVPVSGKLDDPDISLNAIINKALLSSLSTGAMTYATLILQPYGSIILAADLASDLIAEAIKPKLTPIIFDELQSSLNPDMQDYITKIAALLIKSDEFRLQLCGVATRIEGEAVAQPPAAEGVTVQTELPQAKTDAELLMIGQSRSDVVMSALQAKGIPTDRLFTCRTNIDEAKLQAEPRVELILN